VTSSLLHVPLGAQRPRVSSGPSSATSAGGEAVELAAAAGLVLDEWQSWFLEHALGERPDGKWSAFEVGLIVPRQNGKGSILEARELAGLFLFGERLIIHSAQELKTSKEHFFRMQSLINGSGLVDPSLVKYRASNEEWSITLPDGAKLHFLARSGGGGRGFTGDVVILDEAYALTEDQMAALLPTMAAKSITGNPQIWYTSSAPLPTSRVLARVRDRGFTGDDRLAFAEWSASPEMDLTSLEAKQVSNPALNVRISEEFIDTGFKALGAEKGARELFGVVANGNVPDLLSLDDWKAREDASSAVVDEFALAVTVAMDRSSASISVCGANAADVPHAELIEHRSGLSWAADRIIELRDKWGAFEVLLDASTPAGALLPRLQEEGIEPTLLSANDVATSCALLLDHVAEGPLAHPPVSAGQKEVLQAIEVATKRPIGSKDSGRFGLARREPTVPIDPLESIAYALYGWLSRASRAPKKRPRTGVVW
jgi:hypothetical protein